MLPSDRTFDILKLGVGTHNWMYVRKKSFNVSCTWYKSLYQTVMNTFFNYCSAYGLRAFSVLFLFSVTEETCSIYLRDQMPKTADFQANFSVKMMRVTRVQDVNGQALPQEERIKSRKLPQGGQNIYEVSLISLTLSSFFALYPSWDKARPLMSWTRVTLTIFMEKYAWKSAIFGICSQR